MGVSFVVCIYTFYQRNLCCFAAVRHFGHLNRHGNWEEAYAIV